MRVLLRPHLVYIIAPLLIGGALYFLIPHIFATSYVRGQADAQTPQAAQQATTSEQVAPLTETAPPVSHLATPEPLKGLYMTSWVAGTLTMRDHVIHLADTTEVNAIVIDLKDYTGNISYPVEDPAIKKEGADTKRIPDLRALTNLLHAKNIYVIGRVAAFQDPYMVKKHPEYAIKTASDKTKVWKDRKGISWIDAGAQGNWDYLIAIAKDAYAQGVDEIQFDYIRFPTDGNMKDIYFPASEGKSKADAVKGFMEYIHQKLAGTGIVTSADLFGMVTTNADDLGIGQVLENALPNFDYVSPMVYPSHWPKGWNGFKDPEFKPYETIQISMGKAVERAKALGVSPNKLRPWLQDFGLRTTYGPAEVRAQIQATYDVGLTSWLLWDPSTKFTAGALHAS
jgi:hypothetical protein